MLAGTLILHIVHDHASVEQNNLVLQLDNALPVMTAAVLASELIPMNVGPVMLGTLGMDQDALAVLMNALNAMFLILQNAWPANLGVTYSGTSHARRIVIFPW